MTIPRHRHKGRRARAMIVAAVLTLAAPVGADTEIVPTALQAQLMVKVAAFDRALPDRAGATCTVFVVIRDGDARSGRTGAEFLAALSGVEKIAGLPHHDETLVYKGPASVATAVQQRHPAIVYFSTGFEQEMPAIAEALRGKDVLTLAAEVGAVEHGAIIGFDLQSGHPKLVVNLAQAKLQNVRLSSAILRFAQVIGA